MFLLVLLFISVFVGIFLFKKFRDFSFIAPLYGSIIVIYFIVSGIISSTASSSVVISNEVEIYSLKDNFNSSSSFVLGNGTSNEKLKYFYFVEGEHGLVYNSIPASDVSIQFDDSPRLVTYEYQFTNKSLGFWFSCISNSYKVLYIPEDTIYKVISIDLV